MSRTYKIFLAIFVLLLVGITYLEATAPEELNWNPSYTAADKIPLGTFVLYENLQDQNFPIKNIDVPPFEFLSDSTISGTYFFLNNSLAFDDAELEKLLSWIEKGNSAFLSAESFSKNLLDTLGLETGIMVPEKGISSKPLFRLSSEEFASEKAFLFDHETYNRYFSETNAQEQEKLGETILLEDLEKKESKKVNFIRDSIGKGAIYLHLAPKAFSNYFLIDSIANAEYVEKALAYIPSEKTLFWDQYYKTGKSFHTSPLYVILNNRALKMAYYFVIFGALVFILFEGKRKQRSIPVIEPLRNQTYHFTRTVAGLYLDQKDYRNIALKKIALFLEYVRSHYRVPTSEVNQIFYEELAANSRNNSKDVKNLWRIFREINEKESVTKEDLQRLNEAIKNFKRNKNGK